MGNAPRNSPQCKEESIYILVPSQELSHAELIPSHFQVWILNRITMCSCLLQQRL